MSLATTTTFNFPNPRVTSPYVPSRLRADCEARNIKFLTRADTKKAAHCLLEAFQDDSLAKLLTSHFLDPEQRRRCELQLYEAYLNQHIAKGICLGVGETKEGFETVAIWSTPKSAEEGLDELNNMLEAGYGKVWDMFGEEGRQKVFYGMLPLLHDSCERIIESDSRFASKKVFVLVYIGSTERARGKGNARKQFEVMFKHFIDPMDNSISYLESSAKSNIPIYNRFGFHFVEDIVLGHDYDRGIEGKDWAVMNVMIRGNKGNDWTTEKGKL